MLCKYCGDSMEYQGIDDGGGDYGDSICDQWYCANCDYSDENHCIELTPEQMFYPPAEPLAADDDTQPLYYDQRLVDELGDVSDIPF